MDRDEVCSRFLDSVSYELYSYQEEALLAWFESEDGVLVTAPTGMGKTLIAEAAIFEALHTGRRIYYTTPLIALTDQKFREFQDKAEAWGFPREQVGIITGNRRVNPDAPVRIVVAEILLNHLLAEDELLEDVFGVVMDEFHSFNDRERGIVWELSLVLLPRRVQLMLLSATVGNPVEFLGWLREQHGRRLRLIRSDERHVPLEFVWELSLVLLPRRVQLMLLSATVGNPVEFLGWLREQHGRRLRLIRSDERQVPLEFVWVPDKLLTEHLPLMVADDDADNRSPALVFCFNRAECWEVAERLKGIKLIDQATRARIESFLDKNDFATGAGPKLRQMLIRGVGVHHAGILPKFKEIVERLFLEKLIPFVVCTETLAAGVNLPARSVVVSALMKGKHGDKKLVAPSAAHQMFGRAGRPQFDTHGYVYALAPEDDIKIAKWRKRYDQIDPHTKDPGLLRARKDLERKKPSRRKTEQYWSEGQFRTLIQSGPAKLASRSMIPYQVLIYLLVHKGTLRQVREFLSKRFNTSERIEKFQKQLDCMLGNLAVFGHLSVDEEGDGVTLRDSITNLLAFRSIDPLFGSYLAGRLARASFEEKVQVLDSILQLPNAIERPVRLRETEPGPLQSSEVESELLRTGLVLTHPEGGVYAVDEDRGADYWENQDESEKRRLTLPEILGMLFGARLATPEEIFVQPKSIAAGIFELEYDFDKFVRARDLVKNEGLILRHMLRLTILAGEFSTCGGADPDYERLGELATRVCQKVDPRYTDRFLTADQEAIKLKDL